MVCKLHAPRPLLLMSNAASTVQDVSKSEDGTEQPARRCSAGTCDITGREREREREQASESR